MVENFGGNVVFDPEIIETPRTEADVLECLKRHRGKRIRVMGRLHSWSEAVRSDEVLFDLRRLNAVDVETREARVWAAVGAGCQIKRVLTELERLADATMPSLGLVTEQTIAGAIATGTHGSGRHSLSHYIDEVRLATYDAVTGEPVIRTIREGPELRAARCALGCLGVVVSVGFWCRPMYRIEEHFARYPTLDDVLKLENDFPFQQFYLVPWSWIYYAQHRREVSASRSALATLYGWYCFLAFDLGLHLLLIPLCRWIRSPWATRTFFRSILPWTVIRGWRVVDQSQNLLIMEHELFRHIETEVFVRRSQLADALELLQQLLRWAGSERDALSDTRRAQLTRLGLWDSVASLAGRYLHHYPLCIRKVLADETLISMASSDDEAYYALSVISYGRPAQRDGFFAFSNVLTETFATLYKGRPHWGKYCPLNASHAETLYPHLPEFRRITREFDPTGVFQNRWTTEILCRKPS